MRNSRILLLIVLVSTFLAQSCLQIQFNDDGARDLKNSDGLSSFKLEDVGAAQKYDSKESIEFQVVKGEDLQAIRSAKNKTWIYVWGSWCTPCIEKLPKLIEMDNNDPSLNIVLVAEDYRLSTLQKILYANNYNKIPYILDSETYGSNTKVKAKKLNQELCIDCLYEEGFPQNYIYNADKGIELYRVGAVDSKELNKLGINTI